jgi:hypothetical protein
MRRPLLRLVAAHATRSLGARTAGLRGLAGVLALPLPASASTILVTDEFVIRADGLINWGVLGPPEITEVPSPFNLAVPGVPGLTMRVSEAAGFFQRRDQAPPFDGVWFGNFGPGEKLLWTFLGNGPMTFQFSSPIGGFGSQIQQDQAGAFIATISAFDASGVLLGSFVEPGNSYRSNGDDTAIFLGILSTNTDISRIVMDVGTHDFAINGPRIQTAVPEPATFALIAGGLLGLAAGRRGSRERAARGGIRSVRPKPV